MTAAWIVEYRFNDHLLGLGSCSHYYPPPLAIYRWRNRILPYPPAANNDYSELRLFLDKTALTALWLPALESGVPADQGYGKDGEKAHSTEAQVTEDARRSLKAENPPSGKRTNSWLCFMLNGIMAGRSDLIKFVRRCITSTF